MKVLLFSISFFILNFDLWNKMGDSSLWEKSMILLRGTIIGSNLSMFYPENMPIISRVRESMGGYLEPKIIILINFKKRRRKYLVPLITKIKGLYQDLNRGKWTKNKDSLIVMKSSFWAIRKTYLGQEHTLKDPKLQSLLVPLQKDKLLSLETII